MGFCAPIHKDGVSILVLMDSRIKIPDGAIAVGYSFGFNPCFNG